MKAYPGNYSDYIEHKLTEREHQAQEWQDQQAEIAQLKAAAVHLRGLTRFRKGGKADSGDKFAKGFFMGRATKGVGGRARQIEARIEKLLNEQKVERPKPSWQLKLDFGAPEHQSRDVMIAKDLTIGYAQEQPLLTGLDLHIRAGQRIALTGENGSGKTTLVRTISGYLPHWEVPSRWAKRCAWVIWPRNRNCSTRVKSGWKPSRKSRHSMRLKRATSCISFCSAGMIRCARAGAIHLVNAPV